MTDEFDLVIEQATPIGNYWITLRHVKSGNAMKMHLDYGDIVKIRDHLETLIQERERRRND